MHDWSEIRHIEGLHVPPPTRPDEIEEAQAVVGVTFPPSLMSMYRFCDGVYHPGAYLWMVWPLSELVLENIELRQQGSEFPPGLIAFGDFGTGEPFCIDPATGAVSCWYPMELLTRPITPDLPSFWRGLVRGTIRI